MKNNITDKFKFYWKGKKRTKTSQKKRLKKRIVPIVMLNFELKVIKKFKSAKSASKITGIDAGNITRCCQRKYQTVGNYIFLYLSNWRIEVEKLRLL